MAIGPNFFRSKGRDPKPNEYSRINSLKALPTFSELGTGRHSNMWLFSNSKTYAVSVSSKSSKSSSSSSTYSAKTSARTTLDSQRPKIHDLKSSEFVRTKAQPTFAELGMGRHSQMWLFDIEGWKRWKRLFGKGVDHQ